MRTKSLSWKALGVDRDPDRVAHSPLSSTQTSSGLPQGWNSGYLAKELQVQNSSQRLRNQVMSALGKQTCEFEASLVYIVSFSQGSLVRAVLKTQGKGDGYTRSRKEKEWKEIGGRKEEGKLTQ